VSAGWLPYERGAVLRDTRDDQAKLREAWRVIRERVDAGLPVVNLTGLERSLVLEGVDPGLLDDELAPVLAGERFRELALEHLGGDPDVHDVLLANRLTAGLVAAMQVLVRPGDTVLGVSAGYSHPAVVRAVELAGGRLADTVGAEAFLAELGRMERVDGVVVTRLAVTYEALNTGELERVVAAARERGIPVVADDAGGARVGPAVLGQPHMLELGVDLVATGLDKYGTSGPRLGLVAGERELLAAVRARAVELGLEARPLLIPAAARSLDRYRPERVRELVAATDRFGDALTELLGPLVSRTPVIVKLRGEDLLAAAMERAGLESPPVVPVEATAAVAMQLLRDHGLLTVHFAAVPPGTPDLLLKFIQPETLEALGGADRLADAVAGSIERAFALLVAEDDLRSLLFGAELPAAQRAP
jgi:L-seryl-tRNA(Ser) seleniumtransferase